LLTLGGLGLVAVQALVCHAFCPYCLVVDASAIAVGALGLLGRGAPPVRSTIVRWSPLLTAIVSALVAVGWIEYRSHAPIRPTLLERLPPAVASLQAPGVVTVVELFNFGCPHCRAQRPRLVEALRGQTVPVRVRYVLPVPSDSSRAWICGDAQGHGEAMVDALFASVGSDRHSLDSVAARLGLDMDVFRSCLDAPATTERLARDRELAAEARVAFLPSIFVGREHFEGEVPTLTLRESILREAARQH
ncbi:MAG: thioredoxin domain-containing protein, partial [Deltaproteobacteria bacterium]